MSREKAPFVTQIAYALINIEKGDMCYIVAESAPSVWARAPLTSGATPVGARPVTRYTAKGGAPNVLELKKSDHNQQEV